MTLFRNQTHQEIWIEHWCHTCFQPDEAARRLQGKDTCCPILARALKPDRKTLPKEWQKMPRTEEMTRSIKCTAHEDNPPRTRRRVAENQDVPLFDETPYKTDVGFVPVDGWPERPKRNEVDHA
jgi:hypothetical protein